MKYSTPEISVLGKATLVIADQSTTKPGSQTDGNGTGSKDAVAAYDLDE
jgi:hypothetical protein